MHFIWQYQFFSKEKLTTERGEAITIFYPGYSNANQGPDFSHARMCIGTLEWHGNVEIHLKASDWYAHHHQHDDCYDSIILHVVWENDCVLKRKDMSVIPVLVLKDRVDLALIDKYKSFMNSGIHMPCAYHLKKIASVQVVAMFDKVLMERLERKGKELIKLAEENKNNWEELFWRVLVKSFGFKINNAPFEELARVLPYRIIAKHSDNLFQLEALLFGQAGLLDGDCQDDYFQKLKDEYRFLKVKYSLEGQKIDAFWWKFMRTRPQNFPTVRIAQLAALLHHTASFLNRALSTTSLTAISNWLNQPVSSYWKTHYHFNKETGEKDKGVSTALVHSIIINAIVPFRSARYIAGLSDEGLENVVQLLEEMPTETNKITREWKAMGLSMKNAFDSQAGIELYTQYCLKRKCLSCSIGTSIIKSTNGHFTDVTTNTDFNCTD